MLDDLKSGVLFPNKMKKVGWIILGVAIAFWIYTFFDQEPNWLNAKVFTVYTNDIFKEAKWFSMYKGNLSFTLLGVLVISGGLLVGFSKEKIEDEFISHLRLKSLMWSVWVTYILLFLAFITVYGMSFLSVMGYHIFSVLILFIIRFNILLYINKKGALNEE